MKVLKTLEDLFVYYEDENGNKIKSKPKKKKNSHSETKDELLKNSEIDEIYMKDKKLSSEKPEGKKKPINKKKLAFFSAVIIAAGGVGVHLYRNRTPEVDVTNGKVIKFISDDTNFDEITELYDNGLILSNASDLDGDKVCYALSGEKDIVAAMDKINDYLDISDRLASYKLSDIMSNKDGMLPLSEEEKKIIDDMTKADLLAMMDSFEEKADINYQDFTVEAIEYCNTARYLDYAEKQVNTQLIKYGSKFLQKYPELIIQSKVIDESHLAIDKYEDIVIKNVKSKKDYEACYYEDLIGCYYNVILDDKYLNNIAEYSEYFEKYLLNAENISFEKFKKEARKALNDYKIVLLKDYDLVTDKDSGENIHKLEAKTSNPEVRDKVLELK